MKKIILLLLATTIMNAQMAPKVLQSFPGHILYKIEEVTSKIKLTEEQQLKIGHQLVTNDSIANALLRKGSPETYLKNYYIIDKKLLKPILTPGELENYLSQMNKNNRFLLALKSASDLKLNPAQIAALRKEEDAIKPYTPQEKLNKIYAQKLDSLLTKPQYGTLMKLIHAERSHKQATGDWNNLVKEKLVTSKDSSEVYGKLYNYQLMKNCVADLQFYKLDAKKLDDVKQRITFSTEPSIMIKYQIVTNGFYRGNLFSEAIKFEKELKLSPVQTDTLFACYRKYELMKFTDKEKELLPPTPNFYNDFQYKNIVKILDTKQFNTFLIKKNEKAAVQLAYKNWNELEKQGLTKDLDKNATLKDFANYQLNSLVASERFKIDNNRINLFAKRDIELKKPALLQQLDAIKQTETNAKSTKNDLKW